MEDQREIENNSYIKGELLHTIFKNEAEHFSIAKIKVLETNEELSEKEMVIKGYFSRLDDNETYLFYGTFQEHKKFGKQYQVDHYERFVPTTKDGLISYLSSDLFYGIGKKTAEKIVETLGESAVAQILNDPSVLKKVPGLAKEKRDALHKGLQDHQGFEHVVVHLSKYGFGLKMAQKIYHTYKGETLQILEENPYQFVFDIEGFGFLRADEVARQNNIPMNHASRIQAACIYVLHNSMQNGHVFLPLQDHMVEVDHLISGQANEISFDDISREILELNKEKKVIINETKVYLPSLYYAETGFCTQVKRIIDNEQEQEVTAAELMKIVGAIEEEETLSYGKEQFQAIRQALESKIMILTGGPGTGKTTVIKGIIKAYSQIHNLALDPRDYDRDKTYPFVLTAPTGRAAKRMTESTGLPAVTIHRLLGWNGHETFEKDENNPLAGKLLVIDEFSMVDTWLAYQLFKAIPSDMQVLIVGDEDQLPSVGPGQVLADLLGSNQLSAVKLDEVYRQKEGSKIIQLAHDIKNNRCEPGSLEKDADFNFFACREHQVLDMIIQIVQKASEKDIDLKQLQVLAPMYRSQAGIHRINEEIQKIVNPKSKQKREVRTKDVIYRTGDKVIQLVNQPEDGVFNGDIGEITAIYQEDENEDQAEQVVVSFDDREVTYERKDLNNLMHAYCVSIHKSQGSEFPIVVLPVVPGYRRMLRKNLLYTAITRAKKSLIICGDKQAFIYGVREEDTNKRNTSLSSNLIELLQVDKKIQETEEELSPYDFL
ncbi:ATP-dependent RecD-like DNA helicase [Aquibacillus koreensis]|uniref:ATP-dependent RecD2 DNA helicase n=1 Tax=Aquibacillus koreensis TaxID=279446 RepID=A0A9X3WKL8_9BACI|nr:ATP-dependent RecD-like DNA helicase [Aquibacillus koreensis]MCT2537653.1 ATP-dependent RecD-like DNA helicase [Aquibacillus koreensis]MDC3419099.1 ATP-dependent RecD-like DNA helicase [Aquibacillus koreensis]